MSAQNLGPLKYGHMGDDFWVGIEFDQPPVARVMWGMGEVENGRQYARLFAAAPDMLAALQDALDEIVDDCETIGCDPDNEPTVQKIRAAIAKATGAA